MYTASNSGRPSAAACARAEVIDSVVATGSAGIPILVTSVCRANCTLCKTLIHRPSITASAPVTASGFLFRLRQYVKAAPRQTPMLSRKRITPHVFRHTTAVHLISARVDMTVIRISIGRGKPVIGKAMPMYWLGWIRCESEII
jgi:hypothetical protein